MSRVGIFYFAATSTSDLSCYLTGEGGGGEDNLVLVYLDSVRFFTV
jgi:hypothetical protein